MGLARERTNLDIMFTVTNLVSGTLCDEAINRIPDKVHLQYQTVYS